MAIGSERWEERSNSLGLIGAKEFFTLGLAETGLVLGMAPFFELEGAKAGVEVVVLEVAEVEAEGTTTTERIV